jgi:hypothetical protein
MWLNAFSGDNGQIIGREPYRAIVGVTYTNGEVPLGLFKSGDLDGTTWYWEIEAACLTPGAMAAIVTGVDFVTPSVVSLEVTPYQFSNTPTGVWQPGIHLFAIEMMGVGANQSGVTATVVVPPKNKFKKAIKLSDMAAAQVMSQKRAIHARR